MHWAYSFCPTPYSWTALLGLVLYLIFFAPGKWMLCYFCPTLSPLRRGRLLSVFPQAIFTIVLMIYFPGMGPMPWTVNSEIYPLWARSTGNACSAGINWIFNVLVSLTFLHTAEYLTYYGKSMVFFLNVLSLLFLILCP